MINYQLILDSYNEIFMSSDLVIFVQYSISKVVILRVFRHVWERLTLHHVHFISRLNYYNPENLWEWILEVQPSYEQSCPSVADQPEYFDWFSHGVGNM